VLQRWTKRSTGALSYQIIMHTYQVFFLINTFVYSGGGSYLTAATIPKFYTKAWKTIMYIRETLYSVDWFNGWAAVSHVYFICWSQSNINTNKSFASVLAYLIVILYMVYYYEPPHLENIPTSATVCLSYTIFVKITPLWKKIIFST
jgi:predicted small integral membrane protein